MRFLPSTVVIIFAGPLSGRLADRFGPRPLMVAGLLIIAVSLSGSRASRSTRATRTSRPLRPDGPRHGPHDVADEHGGDERRRSHQGGRRVRARCRCPAWSAARSGSRRWARSWRPSAATTSSSRCPGVPAATREALADGLGSGAGLHGAPPQVVSAPQQAFVDALGTGLTISAAAVALGALLAWLLIAPGRPSGPAPIPVPCRRPGRGRAGPRPRAIEGVRGGVRGRGETKGSVVGPKGDG